MKMKSVIYAGLGALAMSAPAFAQGQVNQHNVSINLKVTFEGPEQEKETETSSKFTRTSKSKFIVGKFSNKEFLEALVEDGLISEIKGWSVVVLVDQDGDLISQFIVKKNTSPIDVSDYLDYDTDYVVAEWDYKEVTNYSNSTYEETEKWTERGKAKVWLELPYLCTTLRGSYTGKFESTYFEEGSMESKALPEGYYEKSTGGSFDSLVGSGPYDYIDEEVILSKGSEEEYDDDVLVEGSISLGGAKLVNFEYFPE